MHNVSINWQVMTTANTQCYTWTKNRPAEVTTGHFVNNTPALWTALLSLGLHTARSDYSMALVQVRNLWLKNSKLVIPSGSERLAKPEARGQCQAAGVDHGEFFWSICYKTMPDPWLSADDLRIEQWMVATGDILSLTDTDQLVRWMTR